MKWYHWLILTLICILYLVLRLGWTDTIEFGYDQPRLATRVIEYIQNGKFFETQKFAETSPWGNVSWGSPLFYFYAPFFLLSKDPLFISCTIAVFNLISIFGVFYISRKYFSKSVAIAAGLFLATQPWWLIFSRMIYQPTSILAILTISMILFFKVQKKPKSLWLSFLIFSWTFLTGLYFHTISFVLISATYLFFSLRKALINKYLLLGLLMSGIIIIPFLIYSPGSSYVPNNIIPEGIFERFTQVLPGFISTASGSALDYQLGYAYSDFNNAYPLIGWFEVAIIFITVFVLSYNLFKRRLLLFLWAVSPVIFLTFTPLPDILPLPRYFLAGIPALSILYGLTAVEMVKKSKVLLILLLVPLLWVYIDISYFNFIKSYNYPQGHISTYSDTPYLFLFEAFNRAIEDNRLKGKTGISISNNSQDPTLVVQDWPTSYLWKYVFKLNNPKTGSNTGYYLIDFSTDQADKRFSKIGRYGPYTVYEFKSLIN